MKPDVVADALEDDALEVVVEQHARDATKGGERLDVASNEALHGLVEDEASEESAGVSEGHDEAGEAARGGSDADLSEGGPVDLCLLARERLEGKKGLGRDRSDGADVSTEDGLPTWISTCSDHVEDTRGSELWMSVEGFGDERSVRVEDGGLCLSGRRVGEARGLDRALDGVMVKAQLLGDRPDLPVLGVEEPSDAGLEFRIDHRSPRSSRRSTRTTSSAKSLRELR